MSTNHEDKEIARAMIYRHHKDFINKYCYEPFWSDGHKWVDRTRLSIILDIDIPDEIYGIDINCDEEKENKPEQDS